MIDEFFLQLDKTMMFHIILHLNFYAGELQTERWECEPDKGEWKPSFGDFPQVTKKVSE